MADQLKLRGGPTAQAEVFIGAEREVTVDTGLKALRIHDGVTPGGHLVELSASAANSRSVVAADGLTAREALRTALEAAIATAEANRAAAITTVETNYQAGDTATLASANSYTDTAINDLLGGSPDLLNTLNELAEAIGDDADFITTINASISAVQADVDLNETAANAAIAVVQADVDANEIASDSAEAALSGRLDILETDPTTATALTSAQTALQASIAAVQTDVNLNEANAASALAVETAARLSLASDLATEVTNRTTSQTTLQTNIDAEALARTTADDAISATIAVNEAAHVISHNALQASIDTINVDRTELEERLLQAGLSTGLLYVSNFSGG